MFFNFLTRYFEETTEGGEGAAPVTTAAAPATKPEPVIPNLGAAPAAVTPDPKVEPVVEDKPFEYNKTGNPTVDYALGIIGKAGISNEHPAAIAAFEGDFALLRAVLAQKGVAGANDLVGLLENAAKADAESDRKVAEQIENSVYELAGGKEQWDAVQAWGAANADDSEKETLNGLFSDVKTAKIAAAYLLSMYNQAGGVKEEAVKAAPSGEVGAREPRAQGGPISRIQFAEESQKLYQKLGDAYTESAEYMALARRLK